MSAQIPGVRQCRCHPAFESDNENHRACDQSSSERRPADRFALRAGCGLFHIGPCVGPTSCCSDGERILVQFEE
jgi:hypothetical protein